MPSDNNQEMFPIVDEQGNITGAATRGECHSGTDIHEWVVAMAFLHINEVKHFYLIAILLQQMTGVPEQLALGVKHHEACVGVHNVGLGVEACFTCTGTAADKGIQVSCR